MSIYGNPIMIGSSGGGGGGVILSGTTAPTSALGEDEDIYIQYSQYSSLFDSQYGITKRYRKENGVWVDYVDPAIPTDGVHVWTKSTGDTDAAMWVQKGYMDITTQQFVTTEDPVSYDYESAKGRGINLYGLATLLYGLTPGTRWYLGALQTLTDGTNTYAANQRIGAWVYDTSYDVTVWTPLT